MSKYSMTDRVELSEALRSILDDSDNDEKENINMASMLSPSPKITSPLPHVRSYASTPIMKKNSASGRPKSVLTPSRTQNINNNVEKRRSVGFEIVQSPPKKRRHANQVIILRQPRRHHRQSKPSPKPSTSTIAQTNTGGRSDLSLDRSKTQGIKREFTVELETGTATSPPEQEEVDLTKTPFSSPIMQPPPASRNVMLTTPPRLSAFATPSSSEKCLEAAIESQIKMELTEEEIESGLPMLDGLDPTASPLCHFTDSNQRQLYSELSTLEDENGVAAWPSNQEEALQIAANQQLIQLGGKLFYSNGEQFLQGVFPNGRWITRGTSADDSLTNITWLKRMSAPDLDPNSLQSTQMADPRYERPPYSYSTLIQFAISSSRVGKMTLREIYAWIEETFPYFKSAKAGWRNSIRHNLSLHKIFIREPPINHGQPAFWTLRSGTVVRLPEQRMYVADLEHGGTLLQEIAPPPSMMQPNVMMGPHPATQSQQGGFFQGGAMPQIVMVPPPGGVVGNNEGTKMKASSAFASKAKKPPLILPRGSQPYALVPVPLLLPPGQTSGDRPTNLPHILSPVIMGGVRRFAPPRQMVGGRKVVPIAPKINPNDVSSVPMMNHSGHLSMSNTSSGSDSGIDLSNQSLTPGLGSTSGHTSFAKTESTPNRELPFSKKKGQKRKSMPKIWEDIEETEAEDSFTAFFEQELCSSPKQEPRPKGMPVVSTPCKSADLQTWLSPLRSFTPFKNSPLDGDSAIFQDLQDDLSLNSIQTGLTPNFKGRLRGGSATRGPRSNLGSLGDFGLPGLTPEKNPNSEGDHNQSFGHIFGDLNVSLDMGNQGLDIGELNWSVFSPNKQQVT
ncbi:forkhead box protein M1-like [Asterias rubens]|uniref:forkhead box protein M1-like n=1 Tax=Asterias rubens TaxID=7604 RepID=UPI0014551491|nr:forkhead box protein M1-like [Asterias rubens]